MATISREGRHCPPARRLLGVPRKEVRSAEEVEAMSRARVYWFFRRKIKIIVLTAITYAALC